MSQGAVAMIDILGFKGIWNNVPVDQLLEKLFAIQKMLTEHAQTSSDNLAKGFRGPITMKSPPRVIVRMLSDTIVIAIAAGISDVPDETKHGPIEGVFVSLCALTVAHTLTLAAISAPPLAYRGAIASGHFLIEDTFIVGPAVDEAASWMNKADAAVTILEPNRAGRLQVQAPFFIPTRRPLFVDYDVPLKNAERTRLRVVNPYATCGSAAEFHDVLDGTKQSFRRGHGDAIRLKESHTLDFMEFARLQEHPNGAA
jgi:hypothetical protein